MRLAFPRLDLGAAGWLAAAILVAASAFAFGVVEPMQKRNAVLAARAAQLSARPDAREPAGAADKVASVYRFLQREEQTTDWLAKLHGIGAATGVRLKSAAYKESAAYKAQPAEGRLARYEIVLPVSGSYPQIRDFLKRSLAEIPVLSLDQLTLKREQRGGVVHAELRLTLHMVKS